MKLLEHEKITRIKLVNQGYSDHDISKVCNVTPQAIQQWRKRNGFSPNYKTIKVERNNECK